MISLDHFKSQEATLQIGFEGQWHAIHFQPDLSVPQTFVIGAALSSKSKLVAYRVAEEAPRLKYFYQNRFSKEVWSFLRTELVAELNGRLGKSPSGFASASPQLVLSSGHYVSGTSKDTVLSRTFERIVTVVAGDRKPRHTGIPQHELRQAVGNFLKLKFSSRFESISQPEEGLQIRDGDSVHTFDIGFDDSKVASSVVSASYSTLDKARLNVYNAMNDLTMYSAIRHREQIGLAVLLPTTDDFSKETVSFWNSWWDQESYKLKESKLFLIAESSRAEELADQVSDWYIASL